MRPRALALVLATACAADATGFDETAPVALPGPHREPAQVSAPTRAAAFAPAGWLDRLDSPITPWCAAVLVAPDVAITAARCVVGIDLDTLVVGFGSTRDRAYAVADVLVSDSGAPEHALAALRLVESVPEVMPAELGEVSGGCDIASVAYRFVPRADPGVRWLWWGCLVDHALLAQIDGPNCHGDMGAPAFASSGAMIGVAVDAAGDDCADRQRLVTVADASDFFERALDLSRPPD